METLFYQYRIEQRRGINNEVHVLVYVYRITMNIHLGGLIVSMANRWPLKGNTCMCNS